MQCFLISKFIFVFVVLGYVEWRSCEASAPKISKRITVSQNGGGDYTKINDAISKGVPPDNTKWVHILVRRAVYREQVTIPENKPFIVLEGETNATISYTTGGNINDAAIIVKAENFVAKGLTFKNTYNLALARDGDSKTIRQAVAAYVDADQVSFYRCSFKGVQDTLYDSRGRHYFKDCYIQGLADFIMGNGQSVYENCDINVVAEAENSLGYITAHHRNSPSEPTGFVFKGCKVYGTSHAYLGRAWGPYSRVIFFQTELSSIVVPEGWDAWNYSGQEKRLTYAEVSNTGPGSNTSKRVKWDKQLSLTERKYFLGSVFNNADGWIGKQP